VNRWPRVYSRRQPHGYRQLKEAQSVGCLYFIRKHSAIIRGTVWVLLSREASIVLIVFHAVGALASSSYPNHLQE
jgi:hypothetical protein